MISALPSPFPFLLSVFEQLERLRLDLNDFPVDHLCYRVETTERYTALCHSLLANGHMLLTESTVNGRPISCFRLKEPIHFQNREIPILEVPSPKPGSPYPEGYEHIEFVVGPKLLAWQQKQTIAEWEDSHPRKSEFDTTVRLKLADGLSVKFHERPLDEVIKMETKKTDPSTNIAIFVSGTGSNARKIIERFQDHASISVNLLVCNKRTAPALLMAAELGVPTLVVDRSRFYETPDFTLTELNRFDIDFIVLAGFLWLIPAYLVQAFPSKIVNIHPALLPKFGGKGMYGIHVHRAVLEAGESESGITIHYVNEQYDEGNIIFQARTKIDPDDTPEHVAQKVLKLEHEHYGKIVEHLLLN